MAATSCVTPFTHYALAFIFLEYLFTFHQEVELYWRRKFTGASGLFFVNRYLLMSLTIIQIYGFFPMSDKVRPALLEPDQSRSSDKPAEASKVWCPQDSSARH